MSLIIIGCSIFILGCAAGLFIAVFVRRRQWGGRIPKVYWIDPNPFQRERDPEMIASARRFCKDPKSF